MLGKYSISCLGGPDDISGSFARSTELVQRARLGDLSAADARSLTMLAVERLREDVAALIRDMERCFEKLGRCRYL